ncbi:hypothetical protein N7466_006661 [Penicillium verhagenii]|uniref:uncharacterized protein n=1 Tax=Penicillium verhagenii TaxID=1562060 RepID=UPI002544EF40|nr:uncharacterized protein N7466_006661 [Penicillium verhagenii]KAJ5931168.1 hypothetical protein N7466_006661 [Penicillium verhagenii]
MDAEHSDVPLPLTGGDKEGPAADEEQPGYWAEAALENPWRRGRRNIQISNKIQSGEFVPPKDQRLHSITRERIQRLENDAKDLRAILERKENFFGWVFCSSGLIEVSLRIPGGESIMDWALILPAPERGPGITSPHTFGPFIVEGDSEPLQLNGILDRVSDLHPGQILMKTGHKTLTTIGTYNGLRTCLISEKGAPTWEHLILPLTGAELSGSPFQLAGDSGLLVFSRGHQRNKPSISKQVANEAWEELKRNDGIIKELTAELA